MRAIKLVVLAMVLVLTITGCAELAITGARYDLGQDGKNSLIATTSEEVQRAYGLNSRVTNTWQMVNGEWKLVASHEAHGAGVVQTFSNAVGGNQGPFFPLLRPSSTTQTNEGGSTGAITTGPVNATGTGGTATASATANPTQTQTQTQTGGTINGNQGGGH